MKNHLRELRAQRSWSQGELAGQLAAAREEQGRRRASLEGGRSDLAGQRPGERLLRDRLSAGQGGG